MPSTSKSQQRLMGMSYAVKKGAMKLSDIDTSYRGEVKDLVDSMTLKQLKDFASTPHKGLPEVVKENINTKIQDFFKANPTPSDDEVHALADKLGIKPDELETEIYKIVGKHVSEGDLPKGVGYNKIKGGLADDLTVDDIAKKHKVSSDVIELAIKQGIDVESEHTSDATVAYEIAKDHIFEDPKYYDKLKKIEASGDVKETTSMPGGLGNVMNTMLRGMGPIALPGVDSPMGSGDIIAGVGDANDVYDKRMKKKKKKRNVLTREEFLHEQEQLKAFKPKVGDKELLGDGDYEQGPANDPDIEYKERMKTKKRITKVMGYNEFGNL